MELGTYVHVVEPRPRFRDLGARFARRLSDADGVVLPDTVLLRLRPVRSPAAASEAEPGAGEPSVPSLRSGSPRPGESGRSVAAAQRKLNRVHADLIALGLPGCPLPEDGRLGAGMAQAVLAFQRQVFADPASWDGVIGPATRAQLDLLAGAEASIDQEERACAAESLLADAEDHDERPPRPPLEEVGEEHERDDKRFREQDLSKPGALEELQDPAAGLEFEAAGCTGDHELLGFEGEFLDPESWQATADQTGFHDRVLEAHVALSRRRAGPPKRDLSRDELQVVAGTGEIEMGSTAAAAAGRLLAAANADLARARAAGDADALRTIRLSATSGYRSSAEQRRLWLGYFTAKGGYYDQTQTAREQLADGPHSQQAVTHMLTPVKAGGFGLGGRIAAPGYSNHQGGIAIDFWQERERGRRGLEQLGQGRARKMAIDLVHAVWLHDNAAHFGFRPIETEEWHWEYHPGSGAAPAAPAAPSRQSTGAPTAPRAPRTAEPAAEVVRFAQRVLNAAEGERLTDDGDLGRLTQAALERFRRKHGLGAGGVLDGATELALAQRALEELAQASMFARLGTRDSRTEQALITFRAAHQLGMDAALDAGTRQALTGALARMAPKPRASPAAPPSPASATPSAYLGGRLWTFDARSLPTRVAVFCPPAALSLREVDVLVYGHGLLNGCKRPARIPDGIITDAPFRLGSIVAASNRPVVLVVPYLDWANPGGESSFGGQRWKWHALGKPAHLNGLIAEVLAKLGRVQSIATPVLRNLVIAGHSRAYDLLEPLAHSHADPQMGRAPLPELAQVWAFDTTYTGDVRSWKSWLDADPNLQVSVFYRPGSRTGALGVGEDFYQQRGGRLAVTQVQEEHCDLPARRLPALLKASSGVTEQASEAPWRETELEREDAHLGTEGADHETTSYSEDATDAESDREFDRESDRWPEAAAEHDERDRFDRFNEWNADEQHLSAEPELDALAFDAMGSDDGQVLEEEEEFEEEELHGSLAFDPPRADAENDIILIIVALQKPGEVGDYWGNQVKPNRASWTHALSELERAYINSMTYSSVPPPIRMRAPVNPDNMTSEERAAARRLFGAGADAPRQYANYENRRRIMAHYVLTHPATVRLQLGLYRLVRDINPLHFALERGWQIGSGREMFTGLQVSRLGTAFEFTAALALVYGIGRVMSAARPQAGSPLPPPRSLTDPIWDLPPQGGGMRIGGRWYSEHALERMAPDTPQVSAQLRTRVGARLERLGITRGHPAYERVLAKALKKIDARGVPPSVVEAEIVRPGSTNVRMITAQRGQVVVTVMRR